MNEVLVCMCKVVDRGTGGILLAKSECRIKRSDDGTTEHAERVK